VPSLSQLDDHHILMAPSICVVVFTKEQTWASSRPSSRSISVSSEPAEAGSSFLFLFLFEQPEL
jgi:hypothetical protein